MAVSGRKRFDDEKVVRYETAEKDFEVEVSRTLNKWCVTVYQQPDRRRRHGRRAGGSLLRQRQPEPDHHAEPQHLEQRPLQQRAQSDPFSVAVAKRLSVAERFADDIAGYVALAAGFTPAATRFAVMTPNRRLEWLFGVQLCRKG